MYNLVSAFFVSLLFKALACHSAANARNLNGRLEKTIYSLAYIQIPAFAGMTWWLVDLHHSYATALQVIPRRMPGI